MVVFVKTSSSAVVVLVKIQLWLLVKTSSPSAVVVLVKTSSPSAVVVLVKTNSPSAVVFLVKTSSPSAVVLKQAHHHLWLC